MAEVLVRELHSLERLCSLAGTVAVSTVNYIPL